MAEIRRRSTFEKLPKLIPRSARADSWLIGAHMHFHARLPSLRAPALTAAAACAKPCGPSLTRARITQTSFRTPALNAALQILPPTQAQRTCGHRPTLHPLNRQRRSRLEPKAAARPSAASTALRSCLHSALVHRGQKLQFDLPSAALPPR